MNLVVTATGTLGGAVATLLRTAGKPVRSLTRNPQNRAALAARGIDCVVGDLTDPASLGEACRGVRTVVAMATAILSGDPEQIDRVDRAGMIALIDAAERAGVDHFIYVSFPPVDVEMPLQTAKRAVEDRLGTSTLAYTILQPTNFMESWLGPALGFDPVGGSVRLFGTGEEQITWIAVADVARFTAAAVDNPAARCRTFELGGPETLSQREAVAIFEQEGAPKVTLETVPEATLEAQLRGATNALEASFAGLMLAVARGGDVDNRPAVAVLGVTPMTSVRDYARRVLRA